MYEFKVTLDDEDYILFNQYHLLNSSAGKKSLLFYRLIFPAISFLTIVMFILTETDRHLITTEVIVLTILSAFLVIFSKKRILRSVKKRIMKMKKKVDFLIMTRPYLSSMKKICMKLRQCLKT